jgi:2-C-methyl-D-erythritol 2,4-cyclodiphosphate synthase
VTLRVGSGFDVHAFAPPGATGGGVTLGGVRIPHARSVVAHSDGDVLLHAICDALLGAAALGDIGRHFPDTDPRWKGADSRALLRAVDEKLKAAGFAVVNVDATVIAEAPKVSPHAEQMRAHIASDLGLPIGAVSVKATTSEKLGFTGRGEGIAAQAVALIEARR